MCTRTRAMKDWGWLSSEPNGVLAALAALQEPGEATKSSSSLELPPVILGVVLVMELAFVSGVMFLLLLSSSVVGTLVHTLLAAVDDVWIQEDAAVKISEALVFSWGFLLFVGRFFQRPKHELVRRLGAFRMQSVTSCMLSIATHSVATVMLAVWQREDQVLVSWENVHSELVHADGSFAFAEILQNLLLAPLREELLFRGAIVLVTLNRMHSVKWSTALSSALFAAIHLVNARHLGTQYSVSYVGFQIVWALLVGMFLSLKLLVSGSLSECLALHVINNVFAMGVSKQFKMDLTQPVIVCSVVTAVTMNAVAIARQLQLLQPTDKNKKGS